MKSKYVKLAARVAPYAAIAGRQLVRYAGNRAKDYVYGKSSSKPKSRISPPKAKANFGFRGTGKLGGFVGRGKRVRKTKFSQAQRYGVYQQVEIYKSVTGSQTLAVGHATNPVKVVFGSVAHALLKKFVERDAICFSDWNTVVVGNTKYPTGAKFYISYRDTDAGTMADSLVITIGGATTFEDIALAIYTTISTLSSKYSMQLMYAVTGAGLLLTTLYLNTAFVKLHTKSALKFQNITIDTGASTEQDDVRNQPLNGKAYEGKGTGADVYWIGAGAASNLVCDTAYGVLGVSDPVEDIPQPKVVQRASKFSKVRIDAGAIKTSVLTTNHKIRMSDLVSMLNSGVEGYNRMGKFRIFILERLIGGNFGSATMQVRIEHQLDQSATVIGGNPPYMKTKFVAVQL
ncbi:putative capsid protein [Lake Sarah-associated circular virus-1]|uniref:putative capsid protein n=1 Tax=Lake Sarah-associated circular virus-1 TaxID=1685735 RepID=UPI0007774E74|nr:putative capsid protein [Lake Sarah-associated circular virus-1]ALE29568.1 putative capsid protein [Lake Sarah-associated circular virus-1]ALE29570.1 putative capsid protein [Lake Sarah-associated circular virus-1]ALE29572.1 putative capsid protein [Lake Sarah-associated circular virus-1]ALE29574.1 putative capsid protein [Lake Sarah-associated circular virus-1]